MSRVGLQLDAAFDVYRSGERLCSLLQVPYQRLAPMAVEWFRHDRFCRACLRRPELAPPGAVDVHVHCAALARVKGDVRHNALLACSLGLWTQSRAKHVDSEKRQCPWCDEGCEETAHHMLWQCERFGQ
eukprot:7377360-Alexandrium_andersonii.AAC.1